MEPRPTSPPTSSDSEYFSESAARPTQPATLAELMEVAGDVHGALPPVLPNPRLPLGPLPAQRPVWNRFFWSVFKLGLPLAILVRLTFNYSEVRGASMMPGIHDRDRILVDQLTYAFAPVDRGDVVVLRYPLDPRMDYIKRVVGLPGDEVVVQFGGVWVNGIPVEEPYVSVRAIDPSTSLRTTVRPGHYFVLGDNRIKSSDSRDFGQVPQELVRGLVRLRVWPLERFGWID